MKTIEAYKISNGLIFEDEDKAKLAQTDIIGEELKGLLVLFELDITWISQQKALLKVINKRKQLIIVLKELLKHLEHGENQL